MLFEEGLQMQSQLKNAEVMFSLSLLYFLTRRRDDFLGLRVHQVMTNSL